MIEIVQLSWFATYAPWSAGEAFNARGKSRIKQRAIKLRAQETDEEVSRTKLESQSIAPSLGNRANQGQTRTAPVPLATARLAGSSQRRYIIGARRVNLSSDRGRAAIRPERQAHGDRIFGSGDVRLLDFRKHRILLRSGEPDHRMDDGAIDRAVEGPGPILGSLEGAGRDRRGERPHLNGDRIGHRIEPIRPAPKGDVREQLEIGLALADEELGGKEAQRNVGNDGDALHWHALPYRDGGNHLAGGDINRLHNKSATAVCAAQHIDAFPIRSDCQAAPVPVGL